MTTKIVPGGSVLRRSGRHLAELYHAIDFGYVGFVLAWVATFLVLLHVAMRGGL